MSLSVENKNKIERIKKFVLTPVFCGGSLLLSYACARTGIAITNYFEINLMAVGTTLMMMPVAIICLLFVIEVGVNFVGWYCQTLWGTPKEEVISQLLYNFEE